ncbi:MULTISPECIES: winged helix-turn-helix domain-containing protein [Bacillota]|mgnify:CR=1 FL=1|uniref:GntR family transcriptional regulator n=1 Tax=Faecalicoccus pleomorphus TaxID=1323 RepID=A0A3E3DZU9_9FIRM|nr:MULTISPECIES: GntR family transcriptional regulator [Bacillota]MDY5110301.1 GntR family transcriptional regulator [Faecalicoccus sp.]MDY5437199.1 GntR family transcriptional regulator [Peptostreptococcus porci]RGD74817.1 GntR family transcriptional regulator [Faecalicoccus pleomorphus]
MNKSLYMQFYESIKNKIMNKELVSGDQLPSDREACEMYNVSRITVRQAYNLLKFEDLVFRKKGNGGGTYVL